MAFLTTALSTGKGASNTVSVNDWNVGLADNLLTGVVRAIAEGVLTTAAANIDLTSISTAFRHLKIECSLRGATTSQTYQALRMRFNNDASAVYNSILNYSQSTNQSAEGYQALTSLYLGLMPTSGSTFQSGQFGAAELNLLDYQATGKAAAITGTFGMQITTAATLWGNAGTAWGLYNTLGAITRVTVFPAAGNLSSGSRVTIYGIPFTTSL